MPILETRDWTDRKVIYTELLDPDRSRHFGRLASVLIGDEPHRTYEIDEITVRTLSGGTSLVHLHPATLQFHRTPDARLRPGIGQLSLGLLALPMDVVLRLQPDLRIEDHVAAATVHILPHGFYALNTIYTSPELSGAVEAQGWIQLMEIINQSRRSRTLQL